MRLSQGGGAQPHTLKTLHSVAAMADACTTAHVCPAEGCALHAGCLWGPHLEDHAHVAAVRAEVLEGVQQAHAVRLVVRVARGQLRQQRDLVTRGLCVVRRALLDLRSRHMQNVSDRSPLPVASPATRLCLPVLRSLRALQPLLSCMLELTAVVYHKRRQVETDREGPGLRVVV